MIVALMTIRSKLFTIVLSLAGAFILGLAVVVFLFLPVARIYQDTNELRRLSDQVLILRSELALMMVNSLGSQDLLVQDAKEALDDGFNRMNGMTALKGMNREMGETFEVIERLQSLYVRNWEKYREALNIVLADSQEFLLTREAKVRQFYELDRIRRNKDNEIYFTHLRDFETALLMLSNNLKVAFEVMSEEFLKIEGELMAKVLRLGLTGAGIVLVVGLLALLLAIIFSAQIGRNIVRVEEGVTALKEGRLDYRFHLKSRDELGRLAEIMNSFSESLASSIREIKHSSGRNMAIKEELVTVTEETSSASYQIETTATGIQKRIESLNSSVDHSSEAVETMVSRVSGLENMIQEQTAMVEQTTSSVTEMIASIRNVTEITGKKREATDLLVRTAEEGGERLGETTGIIATITDNMDEIRGTTAIIQNVSAQTSLLAMNAAIEAAHAGEYGMGFAVVADEIRKLAEASGEQSKRISGVLKEVVQQIESASASGNATRKAFDRIDAEVKGVASSLDEIASSMEELNTGGQQILEAMTGLRDYTTQVKEGSGDMSGASKELGETISTVENISREVLSSTVEISAGINAIGHSLEMVKGTGEQLSTIAETLDSEVGWFQVDSAHEPALGPAGEGREAASEGLSDSPDSGPGEAGPEASSQESELT